MGTLKLSLALLVVGCASGRQMQTPAPAAPPAADTMKHPHHGPHGQHGHAQHGHVQHQHDGPIGHRFDKAEDWAPMFDDPARDAWQKPDAVVAALQLAPGMTVADVGAGTGYFAMRLASAVGERGRVLAVDVEADMVRYLGERAQREQLTNVMPILATTSDPKLPTGAVDRILVVDTWHHIPERVDYARKLAAALAPGGLLYIVDFTLESERGPPPSHRLAADAVTRELEAAGLAVTPRAIGLPDQYLLEARVRAR